MSIGKFAPHGRRRIAAATFRPMVAIAAALALAPNFAPGDLMAQQSEADTLAKDIEEYLRDNSLDTELPPVGAFLLPDGGVAAPRARARPLAPSESFALPDFESASRERALKALDDVIQQDVLREGRLPLE